MKKRDQPKIPETLPVELLERQGHYRYRNIADLTMTGVLRFDGRLRKDVLARSLRLCADLFPVLGCTMEERGPWALKWVRRKDLDRLPWCDLVKAKEVEEEIQRYLLIPCVPWSGDPVLQGRIVRGAQGDVLCLKSNHAASDAIGFKEVLYTISEIYSELVKNPDYRPAPRAGYRRDLNQILRKLSPLMRIGVVRRTLRERNAMKSPPSPLGFPYIPGNRRRRRHLIRGIPPEKFVALRSYARARDASFNDLMNALFGYAVLQHFGAGTAAPLLYYNPVDLRRYHPECARHEGPRNLSSFAVFKIIPAKDFTFDSLLKDCSDQTRLLSDDFVGLGTYLESWFRDLLPTRRLTELMSRKWAKVAEYCKNGGKLNLPIQLSNAGVIDHERLNFAGIEARDVSLIPFMPYHAWFFVYSTFKNRVSICTGFCDSDTIGPEVESLFRIIEKQVDWVCARAEPSLEIRPR